MQHVSVHERVNAAAFLGVNEPPLLVTYHHQQRFASTWVLHTVQSASHLHFVCHCTAVHHVIGASVLGNLGFNTDSHLVERHHFLVTSVNVVF